MLQRLTHTGSGVIVLAATIMLPSAFCASYETRPTPAPWQPSCGGFWRRPWSSAEFLVPAAHGFRQGLWIDFVAEFIVGHEHFGGSDVRRGRNRHRGRRKCSGNVISTSPIAVHFPD